jgi:hypothetical protein
MENKQAREFLKGKGIHPTEPIYWDLEESRISLDELLEEYAKVSHQSQLREIREILESRINIIKSEPNGIVRETMIDQLLIELF